MILLTRERLDRGLSMSALARVAGLHPSTVSQVEHGRLNPYPGQIEKLVTALDWKGNPDELFQEVGEHD